MKIKIFETDAYPVYRINSLIDDGILVEISERKAQEWENAIKKYHAVQKEIQEMYHSVQPPEEDFEDSCDEEIADEWDEEIEDDDPITE